MRTLVDFEEVEREHPSWSNAVYTTSVILWMLVYQRLNPDRSLEAAVKQLIENPPDFLPDNVRVTEGTLSTNSGAYRRSRTRLHAVQIHNDLTLSLVSDLPDSAQTLADLDEGRTDIQIDLRNQKVVLDTEHIRARSRAMFTKEKMTSLVAYHLVIQFRRQAAALVKRPPRGLSFNRTWTTFQTFLLSSMTSDAAHCRQRYRLALYHAQSDKLPNRSDATANAKHSRNEPNSPTSKPAPHRSR